MKRKNFTLVELLTVIAIIGILSAILIPTVGKARATAEGAQCLSNFKQIATATINYVPLNDGCLPKVSGNAIPSISLSGKIPNRTGTIAAFYDGGNPVGQTDHFVLNSFREITEPVHKKNDKGEDSGTYEVDWDHSGAVWKCPAIRRRLDNPKSKNTNRIGLVYAPAQEDPGSDRKIGRIYWNVFNYGKSRKSSTMPEVKYANLRFPVGYDQIPMIAEACAKTRSGEGDDIPNGPHNGNYAVAFLDGHVESYVDKKGYLHWCVGCQKYNEDKYTDTAYNGVVIKY